MAALIGLGDEVREGLARRDVKGEVADNRDVQPVVDRLLQDCTGEAGAKLKEVGGEAIDRDRDPRDILPQDLADQLEPIALASDQWAAAEHRYTDRPPKFRIAPAIECSMIPVRCYLSHIIPDVWRAQAVKAPIVDGSGSRAGLWAGLRAYFRALASGTEPLFRVIVSDMLIGGTLINVVAMAAAFALFGIEAPTWLATAVFFSPIPYNLFLVFVVWKTTDISPSAWAWPARILAFAWLGLMFFI